MRWAKVFMVAILLAALIAAAAPLAQADVVIQQVPVVDGIFPATSFVGFPVAIQGSDFGILQVPFFSSVTFNGVDAGQAIIWTDTYIVVVVPEGATSGPVVVTNIFGSSNPYDFTVYEQLSAVPCYFAEGTTRAGFEEWLCLLNPGDVAAQVSVEYVFQDATTQTQDLLLAPGQRFSVFVNGVVGPDKDVSAKVVSDQGIVAERSMYFSYHDAWDGGHNAIGSTP